MKISPLHWTLPLLATCIGMNTADHVRTSLPAMPEAVSNNAAAAVARSDGFRLYSFFGLEAGKTWRDVSRRAFEFNSQTQAWRELPAPPVQLGRLASVAAVAGGKIYIFGGYTVAEGGEEISTPEVLRFDPDNDAYTAMMPMPVPVDDSVAVVWRDRWIVLISGWHATANVSEVQVFDTRKNRWQASTPWPGTPVFGHAGALLGDKLVVCDGVRLDIPATGKRQFSSSNECWQGALSDEGNIHIKWTALPAHPGKPRYRMAAGVAASGELLFAGGSDNPYNYNGIGYDGVASLASDRIERFDAKTGQWLEAGKLASASMDHRGLACTAGRCFLIGGLRVAQQTTSEVQEIKP